jgi:7,8-dihydropterin-6-yl-methyl-4-(beta-D-ribofuranosyl)aminobenzene 5'-phosphate synthase
MISANVRIMILVDNKAGNGLTAEHGLSLWIETDGKRILFDTGQGIALESNARALGVDLGETDILVLSHGHYDHTGGIPQVLQHARRTIVYCHPGVVRPRYSIRNGTLKPIHMPHEPMSAIEKLPAQSLHWVAQALLLSERIGITGPIPRETSFEDTGGPFYLDPQARRADPIEDDLALWIRTDDGVIVCVGCSHAGLVNTLNHVRRLSHGLRVRAIIGGFHLVNASRERLDQTIAALRLFDPDMVVPCHCTGELAVAALRHALGERVSPGAAGMTYQF